MVRDTVDRLRQSQEENEMIVRRRDELEARIAALETEYEELLEKTIHEEETSNVDLAESMTDLKVCRTFEIRAYAQLTQFTKDQARSTIRSQARRPCQRGARPKATTRAARQRHS